MNIKVLSRDGGPSAIYLAKVLENFGNVEIVIHNNIELSEWSGLCSASFAIVYNKIVNTTAWDLAFKDIELVDTWFVEDDVAASYEAFEKLFLETENLDHELLALDIDTKDQCANWPFWGEVKDFNFDKKSLNSICRLKSELISKILSFRENDGKFIFLEILFASLAESCYDLSKLRSVDFTRFFGWNKFLNNKLSSDQFSDHIFHPIKSVAMQHAIINYGQNK